MKYSEALRLAIPTITPLRDGNYYNESNGACVTGAIALFVSGLNSSKTMDRMYGLKIEEKDFPVPEPELRAALEKSARQMEALPEQTSKCNADFTVPWKTFRLNNVLFALNDGLEWEWPRIADWLEKVGL